jgi:hypothetical protein
VQQDKIDALIQDENDPKTRAVLVVIQNLVHTLNNVAEVIKDVETRLDTHRQEYETSSRKTDNVLIRGQAVYRVVLGVLALAQSSIIGVAAYAYTSLVDIRDRTLKAEYEVSDVRAAMEDQKTDIRKLIVDLQKLPGNPEPKH